VNASGIGQPRRAAGATLDSSPLLDIAMASVHREIVIRRAPAEVWDALADVGALHTRLAKGFVTDCWLEAGARVVTFANGIVARELIVDVDAERRRVAWAVVGGRLSHHNASAQVLAEGAGARFVWIADFLPDEHAAAIASMVEHGMAAIKKTLEIG
jgi:polyketide cyclase/dehydrase/lipid transport protein